MKKDKSTILLILSILVTIVVLIVWFFFFKIIENKNKHINATNIELESKMVEKENSSLIQDKLLEVEKKKEIIDSYFVDKKQADGFVEYLENIGKDNGAVLSVKGVEVSSNKKDEIINFKISIEGGFNDVMKTLFCLENSQYHIFINNIYLNKEITLSNEKESEAKDILSQSKWVADISFGVLSFN